MRIPLILILSISFLSGFLELEAQISIEAKVRDEKGGPISKASLVLYGADQNVMAYTYTDDQGGFTISVESQNSKNLILSANSLGFKEQKKKLQIRDNTEYTVLFNLIEKAEQLKEVVLKSTQKISANGNVTTLKTQPFTDETEQTVEDVLKKLPGIEVLDDGSIKAHGKFIDKLMIDGEDMFAGDYQILSKNLDAKTLDAVQIFDKFQDNPVLAKVLDSDRVALNLQLKDEFKNIWFGNTMASAGTYGRAKATANVGLLRKKIKFFYFGNYNNLGNKAADQVEGAPASLNLSSLYREERIEPKTNSLFSIDKRENNLFREGQSTFNKALMNSLGFVTKLNPDLKLRGTGYFTNDIQDQLFTGQTIYNVEQNPVRFSENSDTRHNNSIGSGELELKYTGGERSFIKNIFSYRNQPEDFDNSLFFNNTAISQNLNKSEYSFYNHFNYSYVLGREQVLHNYVYFGQNKIEQDATVKSAILNDLFSSPENSEIQQSSNDKLDVFGVKTNLFSNFGDFTHQLEVGYESLMENRKNRFLINVPDNSSEVDSLQNNLRFDQKKLGLKTSLRYSFSKEVKLSAGFSLDHLNIDTGAEQKKEWIFNPTVDLDLRELKLGSFSFGYRNTYDTPESAFFPENYQLTSYRLFRKGTGRIELIEKDVFDFYYKWANELESQSFTLNFNYENPDGRYTTSNQINQDFILSSYRFINGGDRISGNVDFTSYFENLNLSTNLRTTQNWSTTPLQANSAGFGALNNYSASYLFTGTTYFKMPVNFTFKINTNLSQSDFNGVRFKTHWENAALNVTYGLSTIWQASISNNFYATPGNSYYFLGSTVNYQPEDSDFSYRLIMNNLTDEDNFSITIIDDFTTYSSSVRLIPRYFLISAKYRF
jgi:hypothetical protein